MTRDEIIAANPIVEFLHGRGHKLIARGENFETDACAKASHKPNHKPVMIYPATQSWFCHDHEVGGSVIDYVMHERNISAADALRELGGGSNNSEPGGKILRVYDYLDEKGKLLFQVCRFEPKKFKARRGPDDPECKRGIGGARRVPYRLPEVIKAQLVCITEGEKNADDVVELGFAATTNPFGAGKWRIGYNEFFRGKVVVVFGDVGDPDRKGEKHTEQVIASLLSSGIVVRHARQPDGFHDVSDFIKSLPDETVSRRAAIQKLIDEATVMAATPKAAPHAFFDTGRNQYWIRNQRGSWIGLNETQFKRILKQCNVSPTVPFDSYISPLDERLIEIQRTCDVQYAGALAGYAAGVYNAGERRILITESPRIIKPKPGLWATLRTLIDGLLRAPDFDQRPYLYGWLKIAIEALWARRLRPGQGLVLASIHDCGKSLLQNLITHMLGGRAAKPYQFMSGLTPFNSDLFEAEHLMIEDEQASFDIRSRRNFGAQLKNITATEWQRCHAKNRVAISLAPFWRLSMSVNDEPENLMVLPPIDDSIEDKLIILRAQKSPMPMPTATLEARKAFWGKLESELPAFLEYLTQWEIPQELSSDRFGITHFHHPEILQAIDNLAPEFRLLRLIDEELFFDKEYDTSWEGSAEQLERFLCGDDSKCRYEARKLFTFNTACGVYLARLAKKYPERFIYDRNAKTRTWKIEPMTG